MVRGAPRAVKINEREVAKKRKNEGEENRGDDDVILTPLDRGEVIEHE